jgi:hypothetical protein
MIYIAGTKISTRQASFDPRLTKQPKNTTTWLPVDVDWVLGRICPTPEAQTVDYMFYCAQNPGRMHTTTFPDCKTADNAIAKARGENLVEEPESNVKRVNPDEKFKQIDNDIQRRRQQSRPDPRRGGRPGNLGRRLGR